MQSDKLLKTLLCLVVMLISLTGVTAATKIKYPGGKYYIWRYTLKDKAGSTYSLDHPGRWLSHKSVERRKRQGLSLDSTDLPVSHLYLKNIEKIANAMAHKERKSSKEWAIIGTSRWNNTVLVRSNDTTLLGHLAELDFVKTSRQVWESPGLLI